jgi:hypothetical protein
MDHLHWRSLLEKQSATATRNSVVTVTVVLALVTLGGMTQIGFFLFTSCRPRWPRQERKVGHYHRCYSDKGFCPIFTIV